MDTGLFKKLAVIIAMAGAMTAVAVSYIETHNQQPVAPLFHIAAPLQLSSHRLELARCRQLGEAATRDRNCLETWKETRERFLGKGEK